jgi:hypothetical protein
MLCELCLEWVAGLALSLFAMAAHQFRDTGEFEWPPGWRRFSVGDSTVTSIGDMQYKWDVVVYPNQPEPNCSKH